MTTDATRCRIYGIDYIAASPRVQQCAVCQLRSTTLVCADCASDVAGSLAWLATRLAHAPTIDERQRLDKTRRILEML